MIADGQLRVTVGILTYRRPDDLASVLPMVLDQVIEVNEQYGKHYTVDVLVVDNDPARSAADVVQFCDSPLVRYRNEPRPGVSAARNHALDSCPESDLLAFIDDDERPLPGWLRELLGTHSDTGAGAVAGRVVPEYDGVLDPWIAAGRFFVRRSLPTGTRVEAAGAGNLLLDLRDVRALGLRFDEKFGLSGGEDTLFTRSLTDGGRALVWCDEAVAVDRVPAARMSRRWVLMRAWSHGNSAALVAVELAEPGTARFIMRGKVILGGLLRVCGGALRLAYGLIVESAVHQARGSRAIWRGSGMAAGAVGIIYREYGRESDRPHWRRLTFPLRARRTARLRASQHTGSEPNLAVLLSFPATQPRGNPYRVMLENSLRETPGLTVRNFSWLFALTGQYDAFHVHWPEILLSGTNVGKAIAKQLMFAALLLRLRLTRTPIVRTVHNIELPSGISRREIFLLKAADRQTTLRIRLNACTELGPGQPFETIEHGHYRDWFAKYQPSQTVPGRIVFFGLIRRYKGVDDLIQAFKHTAGRLPETSLVVAGMPSTVQLAEALTELAHSDQRIQLLLKFVQDAELVDVVGEAELVVLPYREMHNSAAVLTALSLGRPVLVPDNAVNRALADEVGHGWINMYTGTLSGAHLVDTIRRLREHPTTEPCRLDRRDWPPSAMRHLQAYRKSVAILSGQRNVKEAVRHVD